MKNLFRKTSSCDDYNLPPQEIDRLIKAAQNHAKNADVKQAMEALDRALLAAKVHFGDDHIKVLNIRESIANLMFQGGDYENALEVYSSILDRRDQGKSRVYQKLFEKVQKKEQETINKINTTTMDRFKNLKNRKIDGYNLAEVNMAIGNYNKAKICVLRALGATKMLYGIDHRSMVKMRELLGDIHIKLEEYEDAADVYQSVLLTIQRRALTGSRNDNEEIIERVNAKLEDIPSANITSGTSSSVVDFVENAFSRAGESLKSLSKIDPTKEVNVVDSSLTCEAMIEMRIELGISYIQQNRCDEAIDYLSSALEALETVYGRNNVKVASVINLLADALLKEGNKNKALENYKTAASIISVITGTDDEEFLKIQQKIISIESKLFKAHNRKECVTPKFENTVKKQIAKNGKTQIDKRNSCDPSTIGKPEVVKRAATFDVGATFTQDFMKQLDIAIKNKSEW